MSTQLPFRLLARKAPCDAALFGVAALLSSRNFGSQQNAIGQTTIKALAIEDTDLHFGHVEPTVVLRRAVKYDAPQQRVGCVDAEHLLAGIVRSVDACPH